MLIWIKHLVAGPELAELERWRELSGEARSWLSEFPDAASALDHLRCRAIDPTSARDISQVRADMRRRRDKGVAS